MQTGIFALIHEEKLRDVLQTLHECTRLPVRLIDEDGRPLMSFGEEARYCERVRRDLFTQGQCDDQRRQAGRRAQQLGEIYIYNCPANLNCITYPLSNQGDLLGSVLLGPFLMSRPDSTLLSDLLERHPLPAQLALELYDELSGVQVIEPKQVTSLSKLVSYLLLPMLAAERAELRQTSEKLSQQSRINETIQLYKEQRVAGSQNYFYRRETELLAKVRTGNVGDAKAMLNDLLGYVLFSEGRKLERVRLRAVELTTLLSRVAIEGGAQADGIDRLNQRFQALLKREQDLESICLILQDVVEGFMSVMFNQADQGNLHIRRALRHMAANYFQPLTAAEVAQKVGLSPNYFSALFHRVVGETFRERLTRIRIEESKRLLLFTEDSLTDIAVAMGFSDQSYYCKVFKRCVGMTPGKFRL